MVHDTIEGGGLLPVLRRASHEDLRAVASAIDNALDVFITWDERYFAHERDLTRIPHVIAEYLCRAGGHSFVNLLRGGGPDYAEVVRDVCAALKVGLLPEGAGVVAMEEALLKVLLDRAVKRLNEPEKADLLKAIAQETGRPVSFADAIRGGALLTLIAPHVFAFIARQAMAGGLVALGEAVAARLAATVAGPIGLIVGAVWTLGDIAGPSLRGTIPATAQVAMLRQRMLWAGA